MTVTPEELAKSIEVIHAHRGNREPSDVAVFGYSEPGDDVVRERYAAAGATWWLEYLRDPRGTFEEMLERVVAGP